MNDDAIFARLAAEHVFRAYPESGTGQIDGEQYACIALNRVQPGSLFLSYPDTERQGKVVRWTHPDRKAEFPLTAEFDALFYPSLTIAGPDGFDWWDLGWEDSNKRTQEERATALLLFAAMKEQE